MNDHGIASFSSAGWPALLSSLCLFLFYMTLFWLIMHRSLPVARIDGLLPSLTAFLGTYFPWTIGLFAPETASVSQGIRVGVAFPDQRRVNGRRHLPSRPLLQHCSSGTQAGPHGTVQGCAASVAACRGSRAVRHVAAILLAPDPGPVPGPRCAASSASILRRQSSAPYLFRF